jgi:hypothetical protein
MVQQRVIRKAIDVSVIGLFGFGLLAVDAAPSFAGNCGGHCQVMKTFLILKSLRQIAAALNGRGIATPRGNGKRRRWRTF